MTIIANDEAAASVRENPVGCGLNPGLLIADC